MIKAVMFDAIDTLFCPYPDKITQYQRVIEKHTGIKFDKDILSKRWDEVVSEAELAAKNECGVGELTAWDNFNAKLLIKLGYQNDPYSVGKKIKGETWDNPGNYILFDDVISTLELLKAQGMMIACVSNEDSGLNNFFVHFNLNKYFDHIIISEEVNCEKPNSEIFEIAVQKMGVKKDEVIFVGDSLISDYFGAKNAGLNPILIDRDSKITDNQITSIKNLNEILKLVIEGTEYASTTS